MHINRVPDTVPGLLEALAKENPRGIASWHREAAQGWVPTTWQELWEEVRKRAEAFRLMGLAKGDRLAIFARTCREWQVAEMAGLAAAGVIVGIEPHSAAEQAAWVLEHSAARCLVVDTWENLQKIPSRIWERLRFVLLLERGDDRVDARNLVPWNAVVSLHGNGDRAVPWRGPTGSDAATLVYTSGTSGTPKGIEYTHGQLMAACRAMLTEFPSLGRSDSTLCWLPMAPLFQRLVNLVAYAGEMATYFVEDPHTIMNCVRDAKPTVFVAVPRFYEKLYEGIQAVLAEQSRWRRRLTDAAIATGVEQSRRRRCGETLPWRLRTKHLILDQLVLRKIRFAMGGKIKWMITGSAPTAPWLLEFFDAIGLLVLEGYALTENAIPIAANRPHSFRFGSVGKLFAMNEIRFAEDGELLVRGPGLFRGYHRDERPQDLFTSDGYYGTGDYARQDEEGFLYLIGRKSEIIKTSTGRRVSPAQVEAVYRQSRFVDDVVVIGDNRKHLAALVTLNVPAVESVLHQVGLRRPSQQELPKMPFVEDLIRRELELYGRALAPHEQVRAVGILPEPLSVASGDLTTTLKLRRDRIERRYRQLVDELYSESVRVRPLPVPCERGDGGAKSA